MEGFVPGCGTHPAHALGGLSPQCGLIEMGDSSFLEASPSMTQAVAQDCQDCGSFIIRSCALDANLGVHFLPKRYENNCLMELEKY